MQGCGWASNWTSPVGRMTDRWVEYGTSAALQNMVFLLLRHVFKGEAREQLVILLFLPIVRDNEDKVHYLLVMSCGRYQRFLFHILATRVFTCHI